MSELARLLELLYGAHASFATASGVLGERRDLELGERAMRAFQEKQAEASAGGSGQSVMVGFARWGGEEPAPPTELVEEIRFWFERPHRIREEHSSDHPPYGQDGLVSVRDGGRWWRYDPRSGAMSNEQEPEVGAGVGQQLEQLLDPVDLLAGLELTILGETELLGRRAFDVRAAARPLAHHFFHRMPFGEDELRCLVDRERGVLLRKAFLCGGEELSSSEFLELVFDEPISPERFVLTLPPGEEFVSPLAHHAIRDVSVEEAARRASFPVWVVPKLPEGQWRIMVTYVQPSARPPVHEMVHVNYIRDDAQQHLSLAQSGAELGWTGYGEPETIVHGDTSYQVSRGERGAFGPPTTLSFQRPGTHLQLSSQDLELELLLDLADSLVEA